MKETQQHDRDWSGSSSGSNSVWENWLQLQRQITRYDYRILALSIWLRLRLGFTTVGWRDISFALRTSSISDYKFPTCTQTKPDFEAFDTAPHPMLSM